mmetsp:Transcript_43239/g.134479  ORF Transcript_43239/g.134479 Transcript_43239/m.134479 type:complete len:94 (+) Transcript_43239:3-284(+)
MASYAVFCWGGYDAAGLPSPPIFPSWLMQTVDWGWFCTLPLVSSLDPPSPTVEIITKLDKLPPQDYREDGEEEQTNSSKEETEEQDETAPLDP